MRAAFGFFWLELLCGVSSIEEELVNREQTRGGLMVSAMHYEVA